jgi:DNA-binding response OmpR family regulator
MFVELLGGEAWAESTVGEGSVFSFTLPLTTTEISATAFGEAGLPAGTLTPSSRRSRILVVEDDRALALRLRQKLEETGYHVLLAGSGEDAVWLAREEKPQLITLDLALPDMDGFAVLERLKDNPVTAPIPVVLASIVGDIEEGYTLGAADYVVKPFDEGEPLSTIQHSVVPNKDGSAVSVLLVGDEPEIQRLMRKTLSQPGYSLSTAKDGHAGLDAARGAQPDLILLDRKLPDMDGYQLIRQFRREANTRSTPIIIITASGVDKKRHRVHVLGRGLQHSLTKPLSIEALAHEIEATIEEGQA